MRHGESCMYKINGKLLHSRTTFSKFGTNKVEELKKIDPELEVVYLPKKHRYIYILCGKRERKKIINSLKYPPLSYPKQRDFEKRLVNVSSIKVNKKADEFF